MTGNLAEAAAELRSAGREADGVGGDLADIGACRRLVRFAVARYGGVDVLVNNAANTARGSLESAPVTGALLDLEQFPIGALPTW